MRDVVLALFLAAMAVGACGPTAAVPDGNANLNDNAGGAGDGNANGNTANTNTNDNTSDNGDGQSGISCACACTSRGLVFDEAATVTCMATGGALPPCGCLNETGGTLCIREDIGDCP